MGRKNNKVLIVGIDSMIGGAIAKHFQAWGKDCIGTSRRLVNPNHLFLDLRQDLSRWQPPANIDCAVILAGVTALADCEADPVDSHYVNVTGTLSAIRRLLDHEIYVVFVSSNLVFDGSRPNLDEDTQQSPVTEYGRQKVAVERELLSWPGKAAVLRLTKVLPRSFKLFDGWRSSLLQGEVITPFADLFFAPISTRYVAEIAAMLTAKKPEGIFHASGSTSLTYAEAAYYIARRCGADPGLVNPISARKKGINVEQMPRHATLNMSRLKTEFGIGSADSIESISSCIELTPRISVMSNMI